MKKAYGFNLFEVLIAGVIVFTVTLMVRLMLLHDSWQLQQLFNQFIKRYDVSQPAKIKSGFYVVRVTHRSKSQ